MASRQSHLTRHGCVTRRIGYRQMHLFDTSAWFDYLQAKPWAKPLKRIVDSDEPLLLSAINLVELYSKYFERSAEEAEEVKNVMLARCKLIDVNKEIALEASSLKAKYHLALADSLILATARVHDATLVTFDSDFEGLKGVWLVKRRN